MLPLNVIPLLYFSPAFYPRFFWISFLNKVIKKNENWDLIKDPSEYGNLRFFYKTFKKIIVKKINNIRLISL